MKRRFFVAIAVFAVILGFAGVGGGAFAQTAAGKFNKEQYKKALWMVTRFYGAQRSGQGPNWLLMDHTYKVSFVKDADGSRNLEGGWFDCGDHVLFGQTFFYSAYVLAKAYDAFPMGFHDLYHGKDYSDYAASGKWGIDGGAPNGIPDLLEELKYATDWIIKATPDGATFYSQKGDGNLDHKKWVTAGYMSTLPKDDGGEREGSRYIVKNPNDGVMASFAAGVLAVMSKIYRKYDAAYADTCLKHAKNAYAYAKSHKNNAAGADFYPAHKDPATVFVLAASEMYRITGEAAYKSDIDKSQVKGSWHVLDYSNSHDLAAYAAAMAVPEDRDAHLKLAYDEFVSKYIREVNDEKVTTLGGGWGQLRYAGNTAFSVALYSLAKGTAEYDQFIYNQIDYVIGGNKAGRSFVTGYCEGCGDKSPKLPHHRNVFLRDDNPNDNEKAKMTIPERNKYFGYLVGGTRTSDSYTESVTDYTNTEGGIDYNAGLLGALAYIVSKLNPADTSKFGVAEPPPPPPPVQTPTQIKFSLSSDPNDADKYVGDSVSSADFYDKRFYAHVFDQNGAIISDVNCDSMFWSAGITIVVPNNLFKTGSDGCSFTTGSAPVDSTKSFMTAVHVTYRSINKSLYIRNPTSVLPRSVSLSKHGYAMTVRPQAVTFTAAPGREITALSIYNIQGKRIFNKSGNHTEITWNRANLPRGMYLIKLNLNNGTIVQRNLILK